MTLLELHLAFASRAPVACTDAALARAFEAATDPTLLLDASRGADDALLAAALSCARAAAESAGERAFEHDLHLAEQRDDLDALAAARRRLATTARDPAVDLVGYSVERAVRFAVAAAHAQATADLRTPLRTHLREAASSAARALGAARHGDDDPRAPPSEAAMAEVCALLRRHLGPCSFAELDARWRR